MNESRIFKRDACTKITRETQAKAGICASIQVHCWVTVLFSETRPNAKPETVMCNFSPHLNHSL